MLGRNDFESSLNNFGSPLGFNMIFNSLFRNLEKQLRDIEKQGQESRAPENKRPEERGNINISISSFGGNSPVIKMNPLPTNKSNNSKRKDVKNKFVNALPADKLKKFSSLPREQPETNIRRLSNKIIYEISLPGVKSIKDISLLNLEKSRELKAVSENKSYLKTIPNFPIINYKLSKGKLILELDAREN